MVTSIDFQNELALNWDPIMHTTGRPMPANCEIWGLKILDWDDAFANRMSEFTTADLKIPFQYLEQIPNWDKQANYAEIGEVLGRYEGINIYTNSSAQDVNLSLTYHAEALKNGSGINTFWTLENIEVLTKRLQSLVYPQYDGRFGPPNKVLLNIGNIWRNVPLIVKQVNVEYQNASGNAFDVFTGLPKMRKITINCRTAYPLWQGVGSMSVYTAWDETRNIGDRQGNDVFAYEALDNTWSPGRSSTNPFDTAFVNYGR